MIEADRREDAVLVLTLVESRLDAVNAPSFKERLTEAIASGEMRLVLDMTKVEFVDSSGIGALVSVLKRLGSRGDLALTGLRPAVERAFKLTRMDRVFAIFPNTAAAVAHLKA